MQALLILLDQASFTCVARLQRSRSVTARPRQGKYGPNGEVNPIQGSNMPLARWHVYSVVRLVWLQWWF